MTLQLVKHGVLTKHPENKLSKVTSASSLPSRPALVLRPLPPVRSLRKSHGAAWRTCSHLVSGTLLLTYDEVLHEAPQGA